MVTALSVKLIYQRIAESLLEGWFISLEYCEENNFRCNISNDYEKTLN